MGVSGLVIAPELEYLHALVSKPTVSHRRIGELMRTDRYQETVAQYSERAKCVINIVGDQLNHETYIFVMRR